MKLLERMPIRMGTREEEERSGTPAVVRNLSSSPDPEVVEKAVRRRFTAEYKLSILEAVARCQPGEVGTLLRREGLYSSHLTDWRRQRRAGELSGLAPRKRGRPLRQDPQSRRMAELERENLRLNTRLEQAETIIEVQKKLAKLLGLSLTKPDTDEKP